MKLYIVYDCVTDTYSVMSKENKERIERNFGNKTTLGRVYEYNTELWDKYRKHNKKGGFMRKILNYFFNKPY